MFVDESMQGDIFTHVDAWLGGFYELAIEIGGRSDERLRRALTQIWTFSDLIGCFDRCDVEPHEQTRVNPTAASLDSASHLHGVARLPNGIDVACGTCIVREDAGSDWLVFYLPTGSLGTAYPLGGYPFDNRDHSEWENVVDTWLAAIGRFVGLVVDFRLALIGFETSAFANLIDIATKGIPELRGFGLLLREGGTLNYYPRNAGSPKTGG